MLLILFVGLLTSPAKATESLGRLFYSKQQRAQLDYQRLHNPAVDSGESPILTLSGEVRRSSGRHTHWLNDQARTGQRPAHLQQTPVGDSIDASTGLQHSLLGDGQLQIKRVAR